MTALAKYERMRAVHLNAVQAALVDHAARLAWTQEQIQCYREHRLRELLSFARQRSPFHARRLRALDLSSIAVTDLASVPMMTKSDAQNCWDDIVTDRRLNRERAERILTQQEWYSYTPDGYQVFSSGGSSGVRGVYVWSWQFFVSAACLARVSDMRVASTRRLSSQRLSLLSMPEPPVVHFAGIHGEFH